MANSKKPVSSKVVVLIALLALVSAVFGYRLFTGGEGPAVSNEELQQAEKLVQDQYSNQPKAEERSPTSQSSKMAGDPKKP